MAVMFLMGFAAPAWAVSETEESIPAAASEVEEAAPVAEVFDFNTTNLSTLDEIIVMYTQEKDVKVYVEPKKDAEVVATLKIGTEVEVYDVTEKQNWYAVIYKEKKKDKTGWIPAKYLAETIPPAACKHEWTGWQTIREATCTAEGVSSRYCQICGLEETKSIKKLAHSFGDWTVTKEATCTAEGSKTHTCKVCGFEETETIKKADHKFGDWTVTKEATCTSEGSRVRTCTVCKFEETETIKKTAHKFGDWTTTKEATCTEEGTQVRTCEVCKQEETKTIEKVAHTYGEWEVTVEATDHSAGTRKRACTVCGNTQEETFDPEGTIRRGARTTEVLEIQQLLADQGYLDPAGVDGAFGPGTEKAIMQFQTDQGLTADGVAWPETINRLHHEFGPWQIITEPTRTSLGERTRVCTVCGYEEKEAFAAGPVIERGARGENVKLVQTMLNDMGYDTGNPDGIYGPKLDVAFENFAKANDGAFQAGRIWPADMDVLVNRWIETRPEGTLHTQGESGAPANLLLTVVPGEEEDGWLTFDWTLTNLSTEPVTFDLLRVGFGEGHDFSGENVVIELSGEELAGDTGAAAEGTTEGSEEAGSENVAWGTDDVDADIESTTAADATTNVISGTFRVDPSWGTSEELTFCAIATDVANGVKWISNFENYIPAVEETEAVETAVEETAGLDETAAEDAAEETSTVEPQQAAPAPMPGEEESETAA